MQWMGPHMGMFPRLPQRGPPPPYPRGRARPPFHAIARPNIGPAVQSRVPNQPGPSRPLHHQPLPSNHPALSPNTLSKPPAVAADVLDLSAKTSPPAAIGPPSHELSWQTMGPIIPERTPITQAGPSQRRGGDTSTSKTERANNASVSVTYIQLIYNCK